MIYFFVRVSGYRYMWINALWNTYPRLGQRTETGSIRHKQLQAYFFLRSNAQPNTGYKIKAKVFQTDTSGTLSTNIFNSNRKHS